MAVALAQVSVTMRGNFGVSLPESLAQKDN